MGRKILEYCNYLLAKAEFLINEVIELVSKGSKDSGTK
jgi:hypothetical protein